MTRVLIIMRSTIAILNTPCSFPGNLLTLVGYSSVLPNNQRSREIYIIVVISLTMTSQPPIELCISVFAVWGWYKGSVVECCFWLALCVDAGNLYIPTKFKFFHILNQNREQILIQCHYNSILKTDVYQKVIV